MAISRRFPLTVLSLCFATCFNPALASTVTEGYYRFPAVQQNQLVFTAEGDIWHSALDKQQTQRLTTHPALEREPLLARDGQTLYFIANYDGADEIYQLPLSGGTASRLTFENSRVRLQQSFVCGRTRHHPDQPARRNHVLDRRRRCRQGRRRRHRLPCHAAGLRHHHPAAGGPDRPRPARLLGTDRSGHGRERPMSQQPGGRQRPGFPARLPSASPVQARKPVAAAPVARAAAPTGVGMDSSAVRMAMVRRLQAQGVAHPAVLAALSAVERHRFVDTALANQAYEDTSLPIGHGQTISQPWVVARMTEAVLQSAPKKVLEVGTGSGYQAAVLATLGLETYSVERIEELLRVARRRFRHQGLNVRTRHDDGRAGWPEYAPFEGILVTAGAAAIEPARSRTRGRRRRLRGSAVAAVTRRRPISTVISPSWMTRPCSAASSAAHSPTLGPRRGARR